MRSLALGYGVQIDTPINTGVTNIPPWRSADDNRTLSAGESR